MLENVKIYMGAKEESLEFIDDTVKMKEHYPNLLINFNDKYYVFEICTPRIIVGLSKLYEEKGLLYFFDRPTIVMEEIGVKEIIEKVLMLTPGDFDWVVPIDLKTFQGYSPEWRTVDYWKRVYPKSIGFSDNAVSIAFFSDKREHSRIPERRVSRGKMISLLNFSLLIRFSLNHSVFRCKIKKAKSISAEVLKWILIGLQRRMPQKHGELPIGVFKYYVPMGKSRAQSD